MIALEAHADCDLESVADQLDQVSETLRSAAPLTPQGLQAIDDLLQRTLRGLDQYKAVSASSRGLQQHPDTVLKRMQSRAADIIQVCASSRRTVLTARATARDPSRLKQRPRQIVPPKLVRQKVQKSQTTELRKWFLLHRAHPYPTEEEKMGLSRMSELSIDQISTWFINARRRSRGGETFVKQEIGKEFRALFGLELSTQL